MTDFDEPRSFITGPWEAYASLASDDLRAVGHAVLESSRDAPSASPSDRPYGTLQSNLTSHWQVESR